MALLACYPLRDPAMPPQFISNHGMRMVEASLRSAGIQDLELKVWDMQEANLGYIISQLLAYDPDVIGFSSYLWSFPFFVDIAREMKTDDPGRLMVFGGPCARPSMLDLEPYRNCLNCIDVLVINEGEYTFVDIVRLENRNHATLSRISGVAIQQENRWLETPKRPLSDLNDLPSPYRMDLVPKGGIGILQTFRGCPFTCSFCEWGVLDSPKRVCDVDTLCLELDAIASNEVTGTLLVDAGLNLNRLAFLNYGKACRETGFYKDRYLISEIYPARVTQEHIEFLQGISRPLVGVGLQSFDNKVLSHVERSYDEQRFDQTLAQLVEVSSVAVEIILGLPGDTPENFRRSFERARRLPCALRVYHCVVLPSALMIKAPAGYQLKFDPLTLKMQSCLGWTSDELLQEVDFVTRQTQLSEGQTGDYFWVFPANH